MRPGGGALRGPAGVVAHLETEDLALQLALEVEELVDGQLLVQLRPEEVSGQRRVDALPPPYTQSPEQTAPSPWAD